MLEISMLGLYVDYYRILDLGILEHCKTSNPDFRSHPGNLKYNNTFIIDFWIYLSKALEDF